MSEAESLSNPGDDWPTRAADTVVGYVDMVRSKTTGKALTGSRLAVYGLSVLLVAPLFLALLLIMLVRALTTAYAWAPILPFEAGEVWPTYLTLGVLFFIGGAFCWRKKGK